MSEKFGTYGENLYGAFLYGENELIPNEGEIEETSPDLMRYLPYYYQDNGTMRLIQHRLAYELGTLFWLTGNLFQQFFIDTATWGLRYWEQGLGISADVTKTDTARKETLKAKLRGAGTTTKTLVKSVAEAFSGGQVEVMENSPAYTFTLKFVGTIGIPSNMVGLTRAIDDIKPAHLTYKYEFTFAWWNHLLEQKLTWDGASAYTWDQVKTYNL